jgi:hypothetical protein
MRANRVLVCLYLAAAVLPVTAMALRWEDHELDGALRVQRPLHLTLGAVRSEAYQARLTTWFEQALGLRNWSIWIDNTVLYHVFRETKWDSHVVVGDDGVLFERDDIAYYNKTGAALPDPREVDKLADHIAALQRRLQREHRALVPLLVPSKTTVFPDKVPAGWTMPLGTPRPSTEGVYRAMKRALDARGVVYVDGIELVLQSAEPRDRLWGPSARHFSSYAGCLCVGEVVRRYAALTGTPPLDYPCQPDLEPARDAHRDLDLSRLLNAWGAARDPIERDVRHDPLPAAAPPHAPRVLWISSSFGWVMIDDAELSRRFKELHIDYYDNTVYEAGALHPFDAKQHDERWRAVVPTRDLYILELLETYLTPGRFFGADALDALDAALGAEPQATPDPGPR